MSMPYVVSEAVWNLKDADETKELKSDFERCQVVIIEVTTAGFSGTIDIQGKLHELSAFSNVPYIRQDQATVQTPSVAQISHTGDTGVYRYAVLGYWRRLQLVMTRTAGTITCGVAGSSDAKLFPLLIVMLGAGTATIGKLAANSGINIGAVDILSIAAGQNQIGARSKTALLNSGVLATDTLIHTGVAAVYWIVLSDTAALAIELNDSTDDGGTDKWGIDLPADGYGIFIFDPPIEFANGIWLDVSTATCKVTVGYK